MRILLFFLLTFLAQISTAKNVAEPKPQGATRAMIRLDLAPYEAQRQQWYLHVVAFANCNRTQMWKNRSWQQLPENRNYQRRNIALDSVILGRVPRAGECNRDDTTGAVRCP